MRWKNIKEDAAATNAAPAGWAQELDQGIAEAIKGPTFSVSDVIADLDADLAEMTDKESKIGHGDQAQGPMCSGIEPTFHPVIQLQSNFMQIERTIGLPDCVLYRSCRQGLATNPSRNSLRERSPERVPSA